jgi:hypothetical protein
MYHSSATLMPDGSVFVSGSNPNSDYNITTTYPTEYRVETFYPSYYNERRPVPQGLITQLSYGGNYFNVSLSLEDLDGDVHNVQKTSVVVIRTGFSTHTMNMGQRMVQLDTSYTGNTDGSAVLHVSQMPPNPAIMPPGPAFIFVVVNGVPSIGVPVMIGSGQLGQQQMLTIGTLPPMSLPQVIQQPGSSSSNSTTSTSLGFTNAAQWSLPEWLTLLGTLFALLA